MKKIAIDISQIQYQGTGVARYTVELVQHILQQDSANSYILFYNSWGNRFDTLPYARQLCEFKSATIREFFFPEQILNMMWNTLHVLPVDILIGPTDIFFYSDWFVPPTRAATLTTVHDVVFMKYPETVHPHILETQARRIALFKKKQTHIIVDSESTKSDLLHIFSFNPTRIHVVYPGVHTEKQSVEQCKKVLAFYELKRPFILTVGKQEPRKNIDRLIEAFDRLDNKNIELVIVGPKGWHLAKNHERVKMLGYVDDKELYALYQTALCFVLPSLYEGFGFPLLEAMSLKCPTACSNTSSLKEIGEKASLLFDPLNVSDMTQALSQLIVDEHVRHDLIKKGLERARKFTWKKTAKQVIEIFKSL